ncbi:MAG: universal stress protein [Dehalococcoidia bacterium]|nr:universal stress protein [Dehalococcoidia bacterium]
MYKNIVVALDGSELAETVLQHVATVTKGCEEAQVTLLRVVEPIETTYADTLPPLTLDQSYQVQIAETAYAKKYLNEIAKKLTISGIKAAAVVLTGKAADSIVDYVNQNNADLVVLASHGKSGISRWMWGSVTDRVIHHVCAAVLMVRAPGCGSLHKG